VGEGAILVLPVGVHDGEGLGEGFKGEVVVENDDVGPLGGGDGVMAEGAAGDAENQVVGLGQLHSGIRAA